MRALAVVAPDVVELQERPALQRAAGEVLVHPHMTGICGTDLDIIDGTIDPAFIRYPIVIGHEWAGTIAASDDPALPVGTRVVVEGVISCGHCKECLAGNTNRCETYDEFGFTRDGAAATELLTPADQVHVLADTVSWESAVLVEPAAVVYRALSNAAISAGSRVLVIGDGTVGLLAATLVRQFHPESVTLLGLRLEQESLAQAAGVDAFVTDTSHLESTFDVVVEAAGAVAATELALRRASRGGRIVLLGYPGQGKTVSFAPDDVVNNDLTIMGSFSYTRSAWKSVVDLLNSGLDLGWLVTHRFALAEFEQAVSTLRHATGTRGKVLLTLQ